MEETNISNDTNQSFKTPPVNPINPKPNNIYKYLFFITLIVFLGFIIYFYVNTNNKKTQSLSDNRTEEIIGVTPTEIVKESSNENKEEQENNKEDTKNIYKAVFVDDVKNSITKLVLIDQDNTETVIDEEKYSYTAENAMKVGYGDFVFSPDNNYLYYVRGAISYLYDFKNKKSISLGISADTKEFSPDSKYFYACAESGIISGGAIIKALNSLDNIFQSNNESDSYKCQYNKDTRELLLSKTTEPGLVSGGEKIVSQYKFSEKTGFFNQY